VVSRSNGTTKKGDPYCTLKLKAPNEEITVSVWDVPATSDPKVGQIVSFFNIQDRDGKKSARLADMHPGRMVQEGDPLYDLIPHPVKKEAWDECIANLLKFCKDETLKEIVKEFSEVLYKPYSQYPAANSVHHAFHGGLLNHTYQMLRAFEGLYPCLSYHVEPEHCILAILFHDYGKTYEYTKDGGRTPLGYLLGHIYISAQKLHKELEKRNVDKPTIARIVHIVLAHHGSLEFGSPVLPCTQEAVLVNLLDNLSAKGDNIDGTGNLEKSFALGTAVVKDFSNSDDFKF